MQALTDHLTLTSSKHTRELSIKLLPFVLTISLDVIALFYPTYSIKLIAKNV